MSSARHFSLSFRLFFKSLCLFWLCLCSLLFEFPANAQISLQRSFPPGWNLVSIPLDPVEKKPSAALQGIRTPLRMYAYSEGDMLASNDAGFPALRPGVANWLLLSETTSVRIQGYIINPEEQFQIRLYPGWNLIANPWFTPIAWSNDRVSVYNGQDTVSLSLASINDWIKGELREYDSPGGTYHVINPNASPAGELQPWKGYLLFSYINALLNFSPPGMEGTIPFVKIDSPEDDANILSPVAVIGSASHENLYQYSLEYALSGTANYTLIAAGDSSILDATLGTLDPTMLLNGPYTLRLSAVTRTGRTASITTSVRVKGEQKIGNFTLTYTDLEIPVSGLPIRIIRTYDSRDKRHGDFGVGWQLTTQNVRLETSGVLGKGWEGTVSGGIIRSYCIQPTQIHRVTITLADGKVHEFNLTPQPNCQQLYPLQETTLRFTALPGTRSSLTCLDALDVLVFGNFPGEVELLNYSFDTLNPERYRLTLENGSQLDIHRDHGLESMTDPNGNRLTFSSTGILHSAGKGISFTRDSENRITAITDPMGNVLRYEYDENGDLIRFIDAKGRITRYEYNSSHGIIATYNPDGALGIRNEFDDTGRLISTTNSAGRTITFSRDLDSRQEVITDDDGNITVFEYDENGRVLQVTDPLGGITRNTYDSQGNQLTTTNPLGETITRTFDDKGNKLTETDPLGNTITYTYDSASRPTTIQDPLGRIKSYQYDSAGKLLQETNAAGIVAATMTYDPSGNLLTRTNAVGQTITYEYDTYGNIIAATDSLGNVARYAYDLNGNLISDVDATGNQTTTEVDARGLLAKKVDALGKTSRFEYDVMERMTEVIAPDGSKVSRLLDSRGNEIESTDPFGHTIHREYDRKDRLISETSPLGHTTRYDYDVMDRLVKTIYPDESYTEVVYDLAGRAIQKTDANGNSMLFDYDKAGRVIKSIDPLGNASHMAYDAAGNIIAETDARGNVFRFEYDILDNLTRLIFPDGSSESYAYDLAGRQIAATDAMGRVKHYEYDNADRITRVIDPLGFETSFTYDAEGKLLTQTDALGRTTQFEYDFRGNQTRVTYPSGASEVYLYDDYGNLTASVDPNGATTTYEYDALRRLRSKTYPDGKKLAYTFDPNGRIESLTDAEGTTLQTFDNRDRLSRVDYPDGSSVRYEYDKVGNRTKVATRNSPTAPEKATTYTYDQLNRLHTVTDPDGMITSYSYDTIGNRSRVDYPNGDYTAYTYDALSRLTAIEHGKGATVLARYTYTLDPVGNRIGITQLDGTSIQYEYDFLRRLTREVHRNAANTITRDFSYTYDAVGNRLTKTDLSGTLTNYVYDQDDRLRSAGDITFNYDANGNLISRLQGGQTTTYQYDYENRLIAINHPVSGNTSYFYNANGIRTRKQDSTGVVCYLIDPSNNTGYAQVLEEYDPVSRETSVYYTYGDDLLSQNRKGVVRFYHYDGCNSTRLLTDVAGTITDTYLFDAFGLLLESFGTTKNDYLFTGEQYDPNSGFYYLRARYYSPQTGRFITRDTIRGNNQDPVSLHKYLYAGNNPLLFVDPGGQEFSLVQVMVVNVIINVLVSIAMDVIAGRSAGEIVVNAILAGAFAAITQGIGGKLASMAVSKFGSAIVQKGLTFLVIPVIKAAVNTAGFFLMAAAQVAAGVSGAELPSLGDLVWVFGSNFLIELLFFKYFGGDALVKEAQQRALGDYTLKRMSREGVDNALDFISKNGWKAHKIISISRTEFNNLISITAKLLQENTNVFGGPSVSQGILDVINALSEALAPLVPGWIGTGK